MKNVVVADCTIKLTINGQDVTAQSVFTLSPPSTYIKSNDNGVYVQGMTITLTACAYNSYTLTAPISIEIEATGEDVLQVSPEKACVLEEDYGEAQGAFVNGSSPYDTQNYTVRAAITDAGTTNLQYIN